MMRLTKALLRLYPRDWRQRYEAELETLIDDTDLHSRFLPDLFIEALKMRLTTVNWRYAGAFALAGLAIATVIASRQPTHYLAEATIYTQPSPGSTTDAVRLEQNGIIGKVLSRDSLSELIQSPDLNLYREDVNVKPIVSILDEMKADDLHIVNNHGIIRISYRGLDPTEARKTATRVVTRIMDESYRHAVNLHSLGDISQTATFRSSADPLTMPLTVLPPNRVLIALLGVLAGLAAAFAFTIVLRAPRISLVIGLTCVFLLATCELFSVLPYESSGVVIFDSSATLKQLTGDREALRLRIRNAAQWLPRATREGRHFETQSIILEPNPLSTNHLTIRVRNRNRFDAQIAVQVLINGFIESAYAFRSGNNNNTWHRRGPWIEVLDTPNLPVVPVGWSWFARLLYASLILTTAAALTLAFNRFRPRPQLTAHPA